MNLQEINSNKERIEIFSKAIEDLEIINFILPESISIEEEIQSLSKIAGEMHQQNIKDVLAWIKNEGMFRNRKKRFTPRTSKTIS